MFIELLIGNTQDLIEHIRQFQSVHQHDMVPESGFGKRKTTSNMLLQMFNTPYNRSTNQSLNERKKATCWNLPLALFRNSFRIVAISSLILCLYLPRVSPIHSESRFRISQQVLFINGHLCGPQVNESENCFSSYSDIQTKTCCDCNGRLCLCNQILLYIDRVIRILMQSRWRNYN